MSTYKHDVEKYIKHLKEQAIDKTTDDLARIGETLLPRAFNESDYTNRTYNLSDSYGWAVYYNGRLERKRFSIRCSSK